MSPPIYPFTRCLEVNVDDRRDVERDELRKEQSSHHSKSKWASRFRPSAFWTTFPTTTGMGAGAGFPDFSEQAEEKTTKTSTPKIPHENFIRNR